MAVVIISGPIQFSVSAAQFWALGLRRAGPLATCSYEIQPQGGGRFGVRLWIRDLSLANLLGCDNGAPLDG